MISSLLGVSTVPAAEPADGFARIVLSSGMLSLESVLTIVARAGICSIKRLVAGYGKTQEIYVVILEKLWQKPPVK